MNGICNIVLQRFFEQRTVLFLYSVDHVTMPTILFQYWFWNLNVYDTFFTIGVWHMNDVCTVTNVTIKKKVIICIMNKTTPISLPKFRKISLLTLCCQCLSPVFFLWINICHRPRNFSGRSWSLSRSPLSMHVSKFKIVFLS